MPTYCRTSIKGRLSAQQKSSSQPTEMRPSRPRLLEQGAVDCLFKPFSDTTLREALNAAFRAERCAPLLYSRRQTRDYRVYLTMNGHVARQTNSFVVDDDISVRESLELLICTAGWQPETFASAQAFLYRPRVLAPSCLILDVALPDLNGLDLQKRVAVDRIDMPIIFITGDGDVPMSALRRVDPSETFTPADGAQRNSHGLTRSRRYRVNPC